MMNSGTTRSPRPMEKRSNDNVTTPLQVRSTVPQETRLKQPDGSTSSHLRSPLFVSPSSAASSQDPATRVVQGSDTLSAVWHATSALRQLQSPASGPSALPSTALPNIDGGDDNSVDQALLESDQPMAVLLRDIYDEALRGSLWSIVEAITKELPSDHIFQQLMADPTTVQYARVRLAEVVENFLYATQAQQYHIMASELARREVDVMELNQQVDRLESRLQGALTQPPRFPRHTQTVTTTEVAVSTTGDNPMGDESARRDLMAILEETTLEHEVTRTGEALAGIAHLVEIAHKGKRDMDQLSHVAAVIPLLCANVRAFLQYIDGSLESLEALRKDVRDAAPSRPLRDPPSLTKENVETNTHLLATDEQRRQVRHLLEQLHDAQQLLSNTIRHLSQRDTRHRDDIRRLELALQAAKRNTATAASAAEGTRAEAAQQVAALKKRLADEASCGQDVENRLLETQHALDDLQQRYEQALREKAETQSQLVSLQEVLQQRRQVEQGIREEIESIRQAHLLTENDRRSSQLELLRIREVALRHAAEAVYGVFMERKWEQLWRHGIERVLGAMVHTLQTQREEVRRGKAQLQLGETALLEREVAQRDVMAELTALLRRMWQDDRSAAMMGTVHRSEERVSEKDNETEREVKRATVDGMSYHTRSEGNGMPTRGTALLALEHSPEDGYSLQRDGHVPSTLQGLLTALTLAYDSIASRQTHQKEALRDLATIAWEREGEVRRLQGHVANLQQAQQATKQLTRQLTTERDALSSNPAMRDQFARQEALIQTLSDERNALQRKWVDLNRDYMVLEQRNAELHERCTTRERDYVQLESLLQRRRHHEVTPPSP